MKDSQNEIPSLGDQVSNSQQPPASASNASNATIQNPTLRIEDQVNRAELSIHQSSNPESSTAIPPILDSTTPLGSQATLPLQNSATPKPRRRNGLLARLPKPIRDRINEFLDDGLSYPKIVKTVGTDAPGLTARAVMSWKHGGYQDYLHHQQLLEECRARTERAFNMLRGQNPVGAFQATQQIATAQICEAIADMGGDVLRQALAANPLNYFRMLNSFARLTNGGLRCERHLIDDIILRAKIPQPGDGKGGMSEKAVKEMEDGLQLL